MKSFLELSDPAGSGVVCYGMNTITNAIRDTWESFLGRVAILIAVAGAPFFYFIGRAAEALGN